MSLATPLRRTLVRVPRDLAAVTSPDAAPAGPDLRALGLTRAGLDAIWSAVEALYRTGLHPAVALCIRRCGQVVLDRAIGHARGNSPDDPPGTRQVLATPATPFCIFSASKAVTAIVVHHLDDRGLLHVDDRVADYLPEFAHHGKADITIRHVLTHRAGIPSIAGAPLDLDLLARWDRIVDYLCEARPVSRPGRRLAYHAVTGGFVLGEVVRRVTGVDIRTWLRREVLDPLGFQWMDYGVAPGREDQVAVNAFTGRPVPFPFSRLVERALGVSFAEATRISNDRRFLRAIVPAGNVVATANEVSRFYQLLLQGGELDGRRVFDPRTIRRATTESSYLELDLTLGFPVRYGLGFMLGGDRVSLFGPDTVRAFGHLGFIHVITWADPARHLAVGLVNSGKPFLGAHLRHLWGLLAAISRHCPPLG